MADSSEVWLRERILVDHHDDHAGELQRPEKRESVRALTTSGIHEAITTRQTLCWGWKSRYSGEKRKRGRGKSRGFQLVNTVLRTVGGDEHLGVMMVVVSRHLKPLYSRKVRDRDQRGSLAQLTSRGREATDRPTTRRLLPRENGGFSVTRICTALHYNRGRWSLSLERAPAPFSCILFLSHLNFPFLFFPSLFF